MALSAFAQAVWWGSLTQGPGLLPPQLLLLSFLPHVSQTWEMAFQAIPQGQGKTCIDEVHMHKILTGTFYLSSCQILPLLEEQQMGIFLGLKSGVSWAATTQVQVHG